MYVSSLNKPGKLQIVSTYAVEWAYAHSFAIYVVVLKNQACMLHSSSFMFQDQDHAQEQLVVH